MGIMVGPKVTTERIPATGSFGKRGNDPKFLWRTFADTRRVLWRVRWDLLLPPNIRALTFRIGFVGMLYYKYSKDPQPRNTMINDSGFYCRCSTRNENTPQCIRENADYHPCRSSGVTCTLKVSKCRVALHPEDLRDYSLEKEKPRLHGHALQSRCRARNEDLEGKRQAS